MSDSASAIKAVLKQYETALNASSISDVLQLYTQDGVFMAQHLPTAVGFDAVKKAYDATFGQITLSVTFDIVEVEVLSDEWAFARTASAGTTVLRDGGGGPEANQELFVMRKVEEVWKIARYCFSTVKPR